MSWFRYFRRKQRDEDFAREIEAHLEHEIDENVTRGMNPNEAALAAHRKFGNMTLAEEDRRRMNTIGFLEALNQDLRYTFRLIRLDPGFFTVAILCLALGIGANTAIFHLLDALRLRSLPVTRPQELAEVKIGPNEHCCTGNFRSRHADFTSALLEQFRAHQGAFSSLAAWGDYRFNTATGGEARYAEGYYVSGDYFPTLGAQPALGRLFSPADDRPACASPGVVLGHAYWQTEFGGEASVLGRKLSLTDSRERFGLRRILVVAQVALSFNALSGRAFIRSEPTQAAHIGCWI